MEERGRGHRRSISASQANLEPGCVLLLSLETRDIGAWNRKPYRGTRVVGWVQGWLLKAREEGRWPRFRSLGKK